MVWWAVMMLLPSLALAQAKPRVVATIFPLADVVRRLAAEHVDVLTLLPSGASPHTFEPSPTQMRAVADAAMIVRVGAGLDDWALKLANAASPALRQLVITAGIDLLSPSNSHYHGSNGSDPHVWLDPTLMRDTIVPKLGEALQELIPAQAQAIAASTQRYREELTQLDSELRETLAALPQRHFIAFHSAWRYFAHRYGLEEVAVVEESPGKEPSAKTMARLVDVARRHKVHAVLIEPQYSPRLAQQMANEIGGDVATVDPLGSAESSGRTTYLDLMRFNAKAFAEVLQ